MTPYRNSKVLTEEDMRETESYLASLTAAGRKPNTIHNYRKNIKQCLEYLKASGYPINAAQITQREVMFLWARLPVKESAKRQYLRNLSSMIMFHTEVDVVKRCNILFNREERDRVFISDNDFGTICSKADPRTRVILYLGAFMGLRRSEMANIRDEDIRGGVLVIHGKGHGEDGLVITMRIPRPVQVAIQRYRLSPMKRGKKLDDYLLQSTDHQQRLHRMYESRISGSVHNLGKQCGIRVTTHSLRRYYATSLYYQVGVDLQTLKTLMRHSSINTTLRCYVEASDYKVVEAEEGLARYLESVIAVFENQTQKT